MAPAENGNTCSCQVCKSVRNSIDRIFRVLGIHGWLLDAYVVDFYQDNLWNKLPKSWTDFFELLSLEELGRWILKEEPCARVWPLSLHALRETISYLEINRDSGSAMKLKCQQNLTSYDCHKNDSRLIKNVDTCFSHQKLRNVFNKNVKLKKRHEIDVMAQIVADSAKKSNCDYAVDVGAGIGHLARNLAYKHELRVACIEQQAELTEQARLLDDRIEKSILKNLRDFQGHRPIHLSMKFEPKSSSAVIIDRLKQEYKENWPPSNDSFKFGLIGLHPCGDLAVTLLRFFSENEEARFICIVGCCYMKLTLRNKQTVTDLQGYPLSNYLINFEKSQLSYAALEVACHAVENYCHKLKNTEYFDLKVHAYRAALETILVKKDSSWHHGHVGNVKLTGQMSFPESVNFINISVIAPYIVSWGKAFEDSIRRHLYPTVNLHISTYLSNYLPKHFFHLSRYCEKVTQNLSEKNKPCKPDVKSEMISQLLENWQQVVIFCALRMMLAPLVESVVLLDRFLFLSEKNLNPQIKAVFDPLKSPRNFVLSSIKHSK